MRFFYSILWYQVQFVYLILWFRSRETKEIAELEEFLYQLSTESKAEAAE